MAWSPFPNSCRVFLVLGTTDMRKSFNTLAIVADAKGLDVFSGDCFVFCNRRRNLIKCLYYLKNGFCLWQKRLDKHRFQWPQTEAEVRHIDAMTFAWLLEGFNIDQAHQSLEYEVLI